MLGGRWGLDLCWWFGLNVRAEVRRSAREGGMPCFTAERAEGNPVVQLHAVCDWSHLLSSLLPR